MSLVYAAYVGIPVITICINSFLAYWIYTHHGDIRGSRWFVATLLLAVGWMACMVVSLTVVNPFLQFVAYELATKAAVWTILAWVIFAAKYSHTDFYERPLVRGTIWLAFGPTLLPTFISPFDAVFATNWTAPTDPFPHVVVEPTPIYAIFAIALAVLVAYSLYQLVRYMLATPRRSGLQLGLLVVGSLSVQLAIVLGKFDFISVTQMNHAAYGALPFSVLISIALFRFRLFEMQPVARNAVVENLRDPVIVLDENRRIVDYNRASSTIWPAIDDQVGRPVREACPALADEFSETEEMAEQPGQVTISVEGRRRHYSPTISLIGDDPQEPTLFAILLRDVTDLEQSRWQLQRQNERLDQVAATISHDLRNPINVADGYAEMLGEMLTTGDRDEFDPETADQYLEKIRTSHERMEEIIDDVLTLAREGQAVEETQPVSLETVATDAWGTVATDDATLRITDDRQLAADASKLRTLLENLYRNAVEHGGPTVTVTVEPLPDGFAVADDGSGIPADEADDVFEYGYSSADGGTGLGLSIVRTIAESHGWTVHLDESADGARFVFRDVAGRSDRPSGPDHDDPGPAKR